MSALFDSSFEHNSELFEASVTTVDPIRFVCTVKTVTGQYLYQVPWLLPTGGSGRGGITVAPHIGDQVVISTGLSYPLIIGFLPRLGTPTTDSTNMTGDAIPHDAGNNSSMKGGNVLNPDKPSDFSPGDHVITSEGGGVMGVLANGSFIARASALAMIFITKIDDLVRIVARNYERFSDVGQQTVANVKGRLYEFVGWDRKLSRSKESIYELNDVIGDVAAGEFHKGEPDPDVPSPVADDRVRQYWLEDVDGNKFMIEVLQDHGKITVTVQEVDTAYKTVTQHDNQLFDIKSENPSTWSQITVIPGSTHVKSLNVGSGHYTETTLLPDTVTTNAIAGGVISQIVQQGGSIVMSQVSGAITTINTTEITHVYGTSKSTVDSGKVKHEHGAHAIVVDSGGVHLS